MSVRDTYTAAAHVFADLVDRVPADRWDVPGLGVWNLRALTGHASQALALNVLDRPAGSEAVGSPQGYYALAKSVERSTYEAVLAAVAEQGRQAGLDLGDDPASSVHRLVTEAAAKLDEIQDDALIETVVGGMRVDTYLATRTFELAVHCLDIAASADVPVLLPDAVLAEAAALAARIAVATGDGATVLRALTGRAALPDNFAVV